MPTSSTDRSRGLRALRRALVLVCAITTLVLGSAGEANASLKLLPSGSAVSGGTVWALTSLNGKVYAGGNFTSAGPTTGPGVVTDLVNGTWDRSFPAFSGATSHTESATPDGSGGWYVGGSFTNVGTTSHNYLVHLLASGAVDPTFTATANNIVRSVYMSGSTLYAAGQFTTVNGSSCKYLVALDPTTGATKPGWTCPTGITSGYFQAIAVQGTRVYAGGSAAGTRAGLVAYDASTGAVDAGFNANISGGTARPYELQATATGLYVVGDFTSIGGAARTNIAEVDLATGNIIAGFAPGATAGGIVRNLLLSGSKLYVVGNFTSVGGTARNRAAAVDATTGALDASFNPNVTGTELRAIAQSGSLIYLGGIYTKVGGTNRSNGAAVDATTGALDANWKPETSDVINDFSIVGSRVFLAGDFTATNMVARNRIAAFDASTGQLDPTWDPNLTGSSVRAITPNAAGTGLYIGGVFTKVAGVTRNNGALVSATGTGALDATFDPNLNGRVDVIAATATRAYYGGIFTTVNGGTARSYLASFDAATGANDAGFNANITGADVLSLGTDASGLYVGGTFSNIGGQARVDAARVAFATGIADGWNPNPNNTIDGIIVAGSTIYLNGSFGTVNGTARSAAAAVDATTGTTVGPWNPNVNTPNDVTQMVQYGPSKMLVVGGYGKLGATTHGFAGVVDTATGSTVDPWDPLLDATVESATHPPGFVVLGGSFTTTNGTLQSNLAWFADGPDITDNQTGDTTIRRTNSGTYDVDFADVDALQSFDVQVWTGPGATGTMLQDWTQVAAIGGATYTTNWALPASTFAAMQEGINYVSVRATSAVGNQSQLADAFTVTKDTSPWSLFTDDANASSGSTHPTTTGLTPHFSWINYAAATADRHRVQVLSDPLDSTVLALWHFDSGTQAVDATGHGYALTLGGAPTTPAGMSGFAQSFGLDGTSQYGRIAAPVGMDLANDFTVDAWFKGPSSAPVADNVVVTKSSGVNDRNFQIHIANTTGKLRGVVTVAGVDVGLSSPASVADGLWHHAALTVDSTNAMNLYLDGVSVASTNLAGPVSGGVGTSFAIGAASGGGSLYFQGEIDDVRVSTVARSAADLLGYVRGGRPHGQVLWDSNPGDTGAALGANCVQGARCADVQYGATGGAPTALAPGGARYWVRAKLMSTTGTWTAWGGYDWFQTGASLTMSVDSAAVSLGTSAPGSDATGTTTVTITTPNPTGYALSVTDASDTTAMTNGGSSIADWSGTDATPTTWAAGLTGASGYFGASVLTVAGSTTTKAAKWGTGTTPTDFANNKYAGLRSSTPVTLFSRGTAFGGADTIVVGYRAIAASTLAPGSYTDTIVYTAVANP